MPNTDDLTDREITRLIDCLDEQMRKREAKPGQQAADKALMEKLLSLKV